MLVIRQQQMQALAVAKREQFVVQLQQHLRSACHAHGSALGEPELAGLANRALEIAISLDADTEPCVRHLSELLLIHPEATEREMASAWWADASQSGELRIELLCLRVRGDFPKD